MSMVASSLESIVDPEARGPDGRSPGCPLALDEAGVLLRPQDQRLDADVREPRADDLRLACGLDVPRDRLDGLRWGCRRREESVGLDAAHVRETLLGEGGNGREAVQPPVAADGEQPDLGVGPV